MQIEALKQQLAAAAAGTAAKAAPDSICATPMMPGAQAAAAAAAGSALPDCRASAGGSGLVARLMAVRLPWWQHVLLSGLSSALAAAYCSWETRLLVA